MLDPLLLRRIEYLKKNIRLHDVMRHLGHRYRTHGNMLCPFHMEKNPSARLYDDQDTFWCWVCSPQHGVDIIEYIILEFGLDEQIPSGRNFSEEKKHALATYHAIEYLEQNFGISYASTPWEKRLHDNIRRPVSMTDPRRYWRITHIHLLKIMAQIQADIKWDIYSTHMKELILLRDKAISTQVPAWNRLRKELASVSRSPQADLLAVS